MFPISGIAHASLCLITQQVVWTKATCIVNITDTLAAASAIVLKYKLFLKVKVRQQLF